MATDFSKMRVVDLKGELKRRGLPQSGLKHELVERLRQAEELAQATPKEPSPPVGAKKGSVSMPSTKKDTSTSANEYTSESANGPRPAPANDVPIVMQTIAEPQHEKENSEKQPLAQPSDATDALQSVEPTASHGPSNGTAGLPPSLSTILNHDDDNTQSADPALTSEAVGDLGPGDPAKAPLPDQYSSEVPSNGSLQGASSVSVEETASEIRKRKRRSGSPDPSAEEVAQKRARVNDEGISKVSEGEAKPSDAVETMQVDVPDTEQHDGTAVQATSETTHVAVDVEGTAMDDAEPDATPQPSTIQVEEAVSVSVHADLHADRATVEEEVVDTKTDNIGSDEALQPSTALAEEAARSSERATSPTERPSTEKPKDGDTNMDDASSDYGGHRSSTPAGEAPPAPEQTSSPVQRASSESLKDDHQQEFSDPAERAEAALSPRRSPSPAERERTSTSKDARFKGLFNVGASKDRNVQDVVETADNINDRDVEAALHPATSALYIRELMRPLHAPTLKAHLTALAGRPGEASHPDVITEFFLDSIRTHCLVAFTNVSAAARVRSALHHTVWPEERSRKALWVDFVPEEKIGEWIETEQRAAGGGGGRGGNKRWEVIYEADNDDYGGANEEGHGGVQAILREVGTHGSIGGGGRGHGHGQGAMGAPLGPRGRDIYDSRQTGSSSQKQQQQQGQQTRGGPSSKSTTNVGFTALDSLFESTTSKPKLYFLPVEKRLAEKRLDQFARLSSSRGGRGGGARRGGGGGGRRGDDQELHRYTFEDGDLLVDEGPELGGGGGGGGGGRYRGGGGPPPGPFPPRRGGGNNSWHRNEGRPGRPPYRRDRW
ncbi:MAG: hypothetical protein M1823_004295 [Watsoniomyces obsoletus]|nr:MAG: hypothetical protein M1823_004295 [Watsoniomyces obsoletus]